MKSGRRTARFSAMTLVVLIAATVSLVVVNIIGQRTSRRFDVTATREHELSPRSLALLAKLKDPYEVVIAAPVRDPKAVDRRALARLLDLLEQFKRARGLAAGASVSTTLIDTGSVAGAAEFESLMLRLKERDKDKISRQVAAVSASQSTADWLSTWLDNAAKKLAEVRDSLPPEIEARTYFDRRSGECRVYAGTLRDIASKSKAAISNPSALVPDLEGAANILRQPLGDLAMGLRDIAENSERFSRDTTKPENARTLTASLAREAAEARDKCSVAFDSLDRLERLDIARISRLVQNATTALLIGPPSVGITAIDLNALLPSGASINAAGGADLGRNAEELIATSLAFLARPVRPIVVLVHGQPRGYFDRNKIFEAISQKLAFRGIDLVMWEAAVNPEPPQLARLNPTGMRPIVYVCFNADTPSGGAQGMTGPERAQKLGRALSSIIESGQPLLLSLFPSTLPTAGEADPTTMFLPKFGLIADSAHPLLHEIIKPTGREVQAWQLVRANEVEQPIAKAIRGLPTRLQWPIPMRLVDAPGARVERLFEVSGPGTWGESQWLSFLQVPIDQHPNVPNPPSPDSDRDDTKGPWILGAAAERRIKDREQPQRVVVIGSNTWFSDLLLRDMIEVDGRPASVNPGNAELFEACISWLAGQDDLIAQSPTARAVPLIGPLSGNTRLALRLLAIVVLPVGTLLLGVLWRWWRG